MGPLPETPRSGVLRQKVQIILRLEAFAATRPMEPRAQVVHAEWGSFLMNGFWRRNRDFFRKLERKVRIFIPFPSQNTLRRWFPRFEERNIAHLFAQEGIDTIIDVGAHNGEFATKMRSCRFRGRIISFEPVSAFHQLLLNKSRADGAWEIAPRMGLGATPSALEIKILGSHSSFQKMLYQSESGSEIVNVRTLDDVLPEFKIPDSAKIALKIDVQGFEKDVLDGALKTLGRVKAILIEVSLKPLYVGEVYYLEMLSYLRDKGFHVVYFSPVVNRQRLGEMWQVDALLIRKEIS